MKAFFMFLLFVSCAICAQGQNGTFRLPADPIKVRNVEDNNWLKGTTESLINEPGNIEYSNLLSPMYSFLQYRNALTAIAQSETAVAAVFSWVKPALRWKLNRMTQIERIKLHLMLRHLTSYLRRLNIADETRYLNTQEALFASNASGDFFDHDYSRPFPYAITEGYRDSEAFLFRRIRAGIKPELMLRYLELADGLINVDVSGTFVEKCNNDLHQVNYTWQRDHFEGAYREYQQCNSFTTAYRAGSDGKYYLSEEGTYEGGRRIGEWRSYFVTDNKRILQNVVDYQYDIPVKLLQFEERTVRDEKGNDNHYTFNLTLDIRKKTLTADVFKEKQFFIRTSSLEAHIDYWDLYGTVRLLEEQLPQPQRLRNDLEISTSITPSDKPKVQRDQPTGNYVMYNKLGRAGKDHALLIATDQYSSQDSLRNPVRDAEFIAENLKTIYGFRPDIVRNPTRQTWINTLQRYQHMKFDSLEQVLIFISGHGSYVPGDRQGYIVPRDGKSSRDDVNHESWISYNYLLDMISKIPCKHILLMIDACYSGSLEMAAARLKSADDDFDDKTHNTFNWFFGKIQLQTKMYITSTTANRQSTDGINHSPFTLAFVYAMRKAMDSPSHIMTLHEVFGEMEGLSPSPTVKDFKGNQVGSTFFFIMQ